MIEQIWIGKTSDLLWASSPIHRFGPGLQITISASGFWMPAPKGLKEVRTRSHANRVRSLLRHGRQPKKKIGHSRVMLHGTEQSISALIGTLENPANSVPDDPQFALCLSPPAQTQKVSEKFLIDLFDLTPAEAHVAALLSRGARPSEFADALGISSATIAFHIRNLLKKGTIRQTDLIALILAGPMAVETP